MVAVGDDKGSGKGEFQGNSFSKNCPKFPQIRSTKHALKLGDAIALLSAIRFQSLKIFQWMLLSKSEKSNSRRDFGNSRDKRGGNEFRKVINNV